MPFWDDFKISSLPELADSSMLIDVQELPIRFRFNSLGRGVSGRYGSAITGKFIDELESKNPFEYLLSQCSATVEGKRPTLYRHTAARSGPAVSYSRSLLPMWGDGHVGMLLGAFAWD